MTRFMHACKSLADAEDNPQASDEDIRPVQTVVALFNVEGYLVGAGPL